MPTLEEIQKQIGSLDGASRLLAFKEIKELPKILWEDERVEQIIQGMYNNGNGVLVAVASPMIV